VTTQESDSNWEEEIGLRGDNSGFLSQVPSVEAAMYLQSVSFLHVQHVSILLPCSQYTG
jgi:hypothetical protein